MSDPILKWLNNDSKLSKKITNIEQDFANGKLFAEILAKNHQKVSVPSFSNSEQYGDKVNNFKLLDPYFKNLNIRIEPKMIDPIVKGERGAALKILYQLKIVFDNKNKSQQQLTSSISPEKMGTIKNSPPTQILGDTLRTGSGHNFYKSVSPFGSKTMGSNAYTDYDKRMDRFTQTQIKNEEKAQRDIEEMQRRYEQVKAAARMDNMEKLRQNKAYLKDLETKGWEEWKKNSDVKFARMDKEKEFEDKMTHKMRTKYLNKQEFEQEDAVEGVKGFELNAQKLGVELEHDPEEIKTIEKGGITTNALMIKLKEQANQAELARKEKEKRMRKMKVDQEKAQVEVENKKNEELLLEKFMLNSKRENEICYSKWREARMEDVLTGNRKLNEETLKEKKRLEIEKVDKEKERANRKPTDDEKRDARLRKLAQREAAVEQIVQKRRKHHVICNHLMNQILELVEISYQQQETQGATQLESKNWRGLSNLFLEDQINPPKKKIRHLEGSEVLGKSTIEAQQHLERYTLAELHNYLNGYGQWQPFHQTKSLSSSTQSKQAIGPTDDFNAVAIPEKPINNTDLGLLVRNLIDMKYPPKTRPTPSSDIPNHLPLRVLALGYPFSGRKTLANFLKQKYGVEVLKMDEILKEAVDLNAPPPPEDPKKAKKGGKKEVEVPKVENIELKNLGLIIKDLQEKGEEIPTEVYIDVFKAKIKELFPPATEDQIIDELKKYKQKEADRVIEAQAQLAKEEAKKKKDPKAKAAAANAQNEESLTIPKRPYYTRGWVLINFPGTYVQAKEFEQVISGFTLEDELLNLEAEDRKRRANVIVEAPAKPPAQDRFIEGGIDCAVKLEVDQEESLRRALGRRVDPNTGNVYHLQDNPPPPNDAKLNDRLQPINDPEATEDKIREKCERYDEEGAAIENWYAMFGDEEGQIDCLQRIEGVGKADEVNSKVEQHLEAMLDFKMRKYDQMIEQYETKKQLEKEEAERLAKKQAEEAEAQKLQEEEEAKEQKATIEQNLSEGTKPPGSEEPGSGSIDPKSATEQKLIIDPIRSSPDPDTIGTERSDYNMRKDVLETLNTLWETIQENYIGVAKEVFNNINEQRNFITSRFAEIQVRFLEILRKQADKLVLLKKFNDRYNRFIEDNPDILDDPETKQELQIKLEELTDSLWVIVEAKKDLAVAERKGIMDSGYIEEEMDFFISNVQKLAQGELERYFATTKLVRDYYQAIQSRTILFHNDIHNIEVLPPAEYAPPIENPEDPDSFPRVETLYANALRVLNGEELLPSELRRSKNTSFSMMGRSNQLSRNEQRKRPDSTFSTEKRNQSALDKEADEIIAVEKSVIKYRLFLLYSITISRLKEMRLMAKSLYNKLDDWIVYGIKAENDVLYDQTKMIKKAIEKTEKLPKDLNPNFPEISSSHKPVNYLDLPPIMLPKSELVQPNRFTLTQLFGLTEELKFLQDDNADINLTVLLQFFNRRFMSSLSKNDFPQEWINQGIKKMHKIIESLDTQSNGFISWKSICTLLCLLDAPIPTQAEIDEYAQNLLDRSENGEIEAEEFARCPSFFDQQDIIAQSLPNHPVFDRVYLLKLLLFSIHKELEHDVVIVDNFIQTIMEMRPLATFGESITKEEIMKRGSKESVKKAKSSRKTYINALLE